MKEKVKTILWNSGSVFGIFDLKPALLLKENVSLRKRLTNNNYQWKCPINYVGKL